METLLANHELFADAGADITVVGLSARANGLIVAVGGDRDAAKDVTADLVDVPFTMAGHARPDDEYDPEVADITPR